MPLDSITRGLSPYDTTQASETGTALVIETSVPILIENLKITGGNANYQNGSLINNHDNGGGVYNEGTLCLFGSAVVGNPSASSVASGYDSSDVSANYGSSYGVGIYNDGVLCLGYKSFTSFFDNKVSELTGGILFNYTPQGGGIYNTATGQVYISSGNIKYNADDGSSSGGGGLMNCGIASMSGEPFIRMLLKAEVGFIWPRTRPFL